MEASVLQVLNEMKRPDGIYFEQKVNIFKSDGTPSDGQFFQLELECDGESVANGGRFVWFNSRLQKVVEIGLSDEYLRELGKDGVDGRTNDTPYFIPASLYDKSREWARAIAKDAGNNTRMRRRKLAKMPFHRRSFTWGFSRVPETFPTPFKTTVRRRNF